MLDFTEQAVSTELPHVSSADTPIVPDSLPGISLVERDPLVTEDYEPKHYTMHLAGQGELSTPEQQAATVAKLAPYLPKEQFAVFVQDEDDTEVLD